MEEFLEERLRNALNPDLVIDVSLERGELRLTLYTPLKLSEVQRLVAAVKSILAMYDVVTNDARIEGDLVQLVMRVKRRHAPSYHA